VNGFRRERLTGAVILAAYTQGEDTMISDVLADGVIRINEYLDDGSSTYSGNLRLRIQALVAMMDAIRDELDTPPTAEEIAAHERSSRVMLVATGAREDD
jgi:hypothetical protein